MFPHRPSCSSYFRLCLLIENQFRVSDKGVRDIKGFGETRIYRLDGDFEGANDGRETR